MVKAGIVVLADTDGVGNLGRVVNAMVTVKEFKTVGDTVQLIFDGAGTKWIGELSRADHQYHSLYREVKDRIGGVCKYCASAYKVTQAVEKEGLKFADQYEDHPSLRQLINQGFQIITF